MVTVGLAAGCGGGTARRARLGPAGEKGDDGSGLLARASVKAWSVGEVSPAGFDDRPPIDPAERYGGYMYGAIATGGFTYGAGYQLVDPPPVNRPRRYSVSPSVSDTGAIVGRVSWPKAPTSTAPATGCGARTAATPRVGAGGALAGAIVYVQAVERGRIAASLSSVVRIGGTIYRDACGLWPVAQLQVPAYSPLSLINDDAGALALTVGRTPEDGTEPSSDPLTLARGATTITEVRPG
ncbi:MAG: hypothetical protein R2939_04340 [Kofleriaceae bacterium]